MKLLKSAIAPEKNKFNNKTDSTQFLCAICEELNNEKSKAPIQNHNFIL